MEQQAGNRKKNTRSKTVQCITAAVILLLAVGCIMIGSTMAYLTDTKTVTNSFTVGDVKTTLKEPDWPGNNSDEVKNQVPFQETKKNPMVENTGVNDEIVFLKVTVPVKTLTPVGADGSVGTKKAMELFFMKLSADAAGTLKNHFSDSWVELSEEEEGTGLTGSERTYVFGYSTRLTKGSTTAALFDKIQLAGFLEDEITAGENLSVNVEAYAIQADNIISGSESLSTSGTISKTVLEMIYEIYVKQNETT